MRWIYVAFAVSMLSVVLPVSSRAQSTDKPASQSQAVHQSSDRWRYTFHNNEWWYWLPSSRWVYWRNGRWNDYTLQTYTPPRQAAVVAGPGPSDDATDDQESTEGMESRPFYGRTIADFDRRPTEANGEVGPFYGNALPGDLVGYLRLRHGSRPFYGHTLSSPGN